MNIEEILKSKWVQKFCKSNICKERTKDKLNKSIFIYSCFKSFSNTFGGTLIELKLISKFSSINPSYVKFEHSGVTISTLLSKIKQEF